MADYYMYLVRCVECGNTTSKSHARLHKGMCARCTGPVKTIRNGRRQFNRNQRILESGWLEYSVEEGH